jgi:hypothetical protein
MKHFIFLLACVFLGLARASAQDANSARDFLEKIYATYQDDAYFLGIYQEGDAAIASPSLLQLIQKSRLALNGDIGSIDADPICNCQDYGEIKVLAITIEMKSQTTARAKVTFSNIGNPPENTLFDLVWSENKWRIDDLKTPENPHSFRELLNKEIRDFGGR